MLLVINGSNQSPLLESNYEKFEELNGAALQIAFNSFDFPQNTGHSLLDYNVTIEDEDGHRYKVRQLEINGKAKKVVATHIFYDLIGIFNTGNRTGTRTFNDFVSWTLTNAGWSFVNEDIEGTQTLNTFGFNNVINLLQRLITRFDCEMQILPNRVLRFARRIGEDNNKQYRYRSNIKSLTQNIDTSNVRTRIIAYGANDISVTYTSPLANNPRFGVLHADPVRDESITDENLLLEFARSSLNDVPSMNIDVDVLDLDGNVGDSVWVIDEVVGLELQTRILSKTTRRDYQESIVEIGNTKKRTIEDAIIDQKEEVKENAEIARESVNDLEEKTDRELAVLTVGQDNIRLEVTNVENTLRSEIVQTASSIRLEVQEVDRSVASLEITADRIQSNVTNLENQTNSSITQLSNSINLKVDAGGSISDINLTQGAATINADKINLNGAVFVNGSISGNTDITVANNAAIGNALYFGGQQGSFDFIEISGGDMTFNSFGDFMFSGGSMYLNGLRVLTTADL